MVRKIGYFEDYINMIERYSERKVERIHTDNVFAITQLKKEFGRMGITLTNSLPYNPQSNGLAGRVNRILVVKARENLRPFRFEIELLVWGGPTRDLPA